MSEPVLDLPDYAVEGELGRGAMGVVYRARQLSLSRPVAIKVVPTAGVKPEVVQRFLREVGICVNLSHPAVVKLLDAGATEQWMYLVMEMVDGRSLDRYLFTEGALKVNQLLQGMEELADAMAFVHAQNIIHRDIKTANVMVEKSGHLRLMDFGLARAEGNATLTGDGRVVGTPRYLAPETFTQLAMNQLTDLYGLGITFWEMATAEEAFNARDIKELMRRIVHEDLPPPSRKESSVPPEVDRIIMRLVDKKPENRYPDAEELLKDIREVRASKFLGMSWETSRPGLEVPPRVPPPAPTGAGRRSRPSAVLRSTGRIAAAPPPADRRPLIAAAVALAAGAALVVAWLALAPARPRPPVASVASPVPPAVDPRLDLIDRFWDGVSRSDLKQLIGQFENGVFPVTRGPRSSDSPESRARANAARGVAAEILGRCPFHRPCIELLGETLFAMHTPQRVLLADRTIPVSSRLKAYHGLLFISHLDEFLENRCGVGSAYRSREALAPWARILEPPGKEREHLAALCEKVEPGGRCITLHRNEFSASKYLFAGLEPVLQEEIYVAGPVGNGYRKQEDRPPPTAEIVGPYATVDLFALTEDVERLKFLRLDFTPIAAGAAGSDPVGPVRTLAIRPITPIARSLNNRILGLRVSAELLPPGRYEIRIRAFRLIGSENGGCRMLALVARTSP